MTHRGDSDGLRRLVRGYPALAVEPVSSCFGNDSVPGYLGVARFHGLTQHERAGEVASVLLEVGAGADGPTDTVEPPLVTAASYGEVDMARALIDAGADLEATAAPDAGGVPGGTALTHAMAFGNTEVVDLLAAAGAIAHDIVEAAGVGNIDSYTLSEIPIVSRARAARAAAVCERLETLDLLLGSGVPVGADPDTGHLDAPSTLLHEAAYWGKPRAVEYRIAHGADPNRQDSEYHSTPLGWCRHRRDQFAGFGDHLVGHAQVEQILGRSPEPHKPGASTRQRDSDAERRSHQATRLHRASIAREGAMGRARTRNDAKLKCALSRQFASFPWSDETPHSGS